MEEGRGRVEEEFLLLVFIVLRCFSRERISMIITRGVRIGRRSLLLL